MRAMPSHPVPTLDDVRPVPPRGASRQKTAAMPKPAPVIAIRIPLRIAGMVLFGVVAILLLSLRSWSVDDPSLSYATGKVAENWLGYPGAVIADLVFQFLGLGGIVATAPLAPWSWALLRKRRLTRVMLRVLSWFGATPLSTGVFAFLPTPISWRR